MGKRLQAGLMAYLMPDGDLIRAGKSAIPCSAGGLGILERFNWDGDWREHAAFERHGSQHTTLP